MKLSLFVAAVIAFVFVSSCGFDNPGTEGKKVSKKYISFSFDDAPRPDSFFTGTERSKKLLETLEKHHIKAAFYINSSKMTKNNIERIRSYEEAGHLIGNHTHSHKSANSVLPEVFLTDFKACDSLLKGWGFSPMYFRYPFLHRGEDLEKVKKIHDEILSFGYEDAFITVDNYDWYLEFLFQKASKEKEKINFENLKKLYVETLYRGIVHYEALAQKAYDGYSPKHVMLLHENDLAALFLEDLILHLKSKGWVICTPEESYADPKLKPFPEGVLRHGQGRVVAHATEKGFDKPLVSGLEDEKILDVFWGDYEVITH